MLFWNRQDSVCVFQSWLHSETIIELLSKHIKNVFFFYSILYKLIFFFTIFKTKSIEKHNENIGRGEKDHLEFIVLVSKIENKLKTYLKTLYFLSL